MVNVRSSLFSQNPSTKLLSLTVLIIPCVPSSIFLMESSSFNGCVFSRFSCICKTNVRKLCYLCYGISFTHRYHPNHPRPSMDSHHQSVLPKGRSFTGNSGAEITVLPKGRFSTANSETNVAVLLGINKFCSFPLLSAPHSLFNI